MTSSFSPWAYWVGGVGGHDGWVCVCGGGGGGIGRFFFFLSGTECLSLCV